jgi:hypothetical protein
MGDPATGDRGGPDHPAALVVEPVEPDQEQVGEVVGEPALAELGGHQLLGEERVALGAADDADQVGGREVAAVERAHEPAYVGVGQRRQRDPDHSGNAHPLGHRRPERVATVQVVAAVGGHEGDGVVERTAEEEAQQVAGGAVGPVGVLDDDEERGVVGEVVERSVDRLEQLGAVEALTGRRGEAGQEPAAGLEVVERGVGVGEATGGLGVGVVEAAEELAEREVGQRAVAEVETVSDGGAPPLHLGAGDQLAEHAGLADPGVAGEQHGA